MRERHTHAEQHQATLAEYIDPRQAVLQQALAVATIPRIHTSSPGSRLTDNETDDLMDVAASSSEADAKQLFALSDSQSSIFVEAYRSGLESLRQSSEDHSHDDSKNIVTSFPDHTSALIAYESIYTDSLRIAQHADQKSEIDAYNEMAGLDEAIDSTGQRLGIRTIIQTEILDTYQQSVFRATFGNMMRAFIAHDAVIVNRIEALIDDGTIPESYLNPDGTFQADAIQELPYFLDTREGRRAFDEFDFATRRLQRGEHRESIDDHDHDHDHGMEVHEEESGACCSTHRKKELSMLRTKRKYAKYPRLGKAISKVKELGWLALCPGDDFANLASNVIAPLFSDGDSDEDHHHKEPNAYIPREPFAVVHQATEFQSQDGEWITQAVKTANIEDTASVTDLISFTPDDSDPITPIRALPHGQPQKRRRQMAAAATLVAAIGVGATGIGNEADDSVTTGNTIAISSGRVDHMPLYRAPMNDHDVPLLQAIVFEQVHAGDTQWGIANEAIRDAGHDTSRALTNIVTDLMSQANETTNPNPDLVVPEQQLAVPSDVLIDEIASVLSEPTNDPELYDSLQSLNEKEAMSRQEKVAKNQSNIRSAWDLLKAKVRR